MFKRYFYNVKETLSVGNILYFTSVFKTAKQNLYGIEVIIINAIITETGKKDHFLSETFS